MGECGSDGALKRSCGQSRQGFCQEEDSRHSFRSRRSARPQSSRHVRGLATDRRPSACRATSRGSSRTPWGAVSPYRPKPPCVRSRASESACRVTPSPAAARVTDRSRGSRHCRFTIPPGCGGFRIAMLELLSRRTADRIHPRDCERGYPTAAGPQDASTSSPLGAAASELRLVVVELSGAMRWVERRVRLVHHVPSIVIGLLADLLARCVAEVGAVRRASRPTPRRGRCARLAPSRLQDSPRWLRKTRTRPVAGPSPPRRYPARDAAGAHARHRRRSLRLPRTPRSSMRRCPRGAAVCRRDDTCLSTIDETRV